MAVKKKNRLKTGAVLAVAAAAAAYGFKSYGNKRNAPAMPGADSEFAEITTGDLEVRFTEIGDISAKSQVNIASKVSGRIIEMFAEEGDLVKAGQRIAVVQPGKTGAEKFLPSTVVSPIEGVLIRHIKNPEGGNQTAAFSQAGDFVTGIFESQNPTYMMTVADMRRVIINLKINEMDILKLVKGMPVSVKVDALADRDFPAEITMISPQAERETRGGKVFRVEVSLKENHPDLRTGMTARVDALLEARRGVLKLPLSGLFEERGKPLVYLKTGGKKSLPKQTLITTGLRTELDVEVLDGLKEGDRVLTEKPVDFVPVPEDLLKETQNGKTSKRELRQARRKARRARRMTR